MAKDGSARRGSSTAVQRSGCRPQLAAMFDVGDGDWRRGLAASQRGWLGLAARGRQWGGGAVGRRCGYRGRRAVDGSGRDGERATGGRADGRGRVAWTGDDFGFTMEGGREAEATRHDGDGDRGGAARILNRGGGGVSEGQ